MNRNNKIKRKKLKMKIKKQRTKRNKRQNLMQALSRRFCLLSCFFLHGTPYDAQTYLKNHFAISLFWFLFIIRLPCIQFFPIQIHLVLSIRKVQHSFPTISETVVKNKERNMNYMWISLSENERKSHQHEKYSFGEML